VRRVVPEGAVGTTSAANSFMCGAPAEVFRRPVAAYGVGEAHVTRAELGPLSCDGGPEELGLALMDPWGTTMRYRLL